ncbi:hypothetical protein ABID21_002935 [Pseudorhizobium tarimense]|uniref:DUF2628 domain-containing protein n=1 Tax=Pseudorhizobium tarimense TaxID=1079109 RepID=A0ABV2H8E0_9HYPH|nr:DUF2628 domain-containing protein [Pseudorhizobium tarimense]MCJ8519782.1 DUF2628 domain-containing protein [Pseudorhizobium tarimense]
MKSYLVLLAPGNDDREHRKTIILPDRFSWLALFFPWIWLLTKRLWLAAIIVFLLQLVAGQLSQTTDFEIAGFLLALSVNLLVALEGRHFYSEALIRQGWRLDAVIAAPDLDAAEEVYFSAQETGDKSELPAVANWGKDKRATADWPQGGIGLFDHQGGR